MSPLTVPEHALAFLLGVVVPGFAALRGPGRMRDTAFDTDLRFGLYVSNSLFLWGMAVAVGVVWSLAGRDLADLGLRAGRMDSRWIPVLIGGFLIWYGLDSWNQVRTPRRLSRTTRRWREHTPFMPETWKEFHVFTVLAVSAGFCEEVIFRGFFISYLLLLLGDSTTAAVPAVLVPAVIFGLSHRYEGIRAVSKIMVMSVIFGIVYILWESIIVLIALHVLIDLAGGVLGVWLARKTGSAGRPEGREEPWKSTTTSTGSWEND